MATIFLHFEVAEGTGDEQTAQLASRIEEGLNRMQVVDEVSAEPEGPQRLTGLEVAAAIGVAVVITRSSRELIEELRKLIPTIKNFAQDFKGIKSIVVEVGKERVPLEQITEAHVAQLAE